MPQWWMTITFGGPAGLPEEKFRDLNPVSIFKTLDLFLFFARNSRFHILDKRRRFHRSKISSTTDKPERRCQLNTNQVDDLLSCEQTKQGRNLRQLSPKTRTHLVRTKLALAQRYSGTRNHIRSHERHHGKRQTKIRHHIHIVPLCTRVAVTSRSHVPRLPTNGISSITHQLNLTHLTLKNTKVRRLNNFAHQLHVPLGKHSNCLKLNNLTTRAIHAVQLNNKVSNFA